MNWIASPDGRIALLIVTTCLLAAAAVWLLLGFRVPPAERERRRRLLVHQIGRMGDGVLNDVQQDAVYFTYTVCGVCYAASQDISALHSLLPPEASVLVGPVTVKYSPRNPVNSIVLCEQWSGLRIRETPPEPQQIIKESETS